MVEVGLVRLLGGGDERFERQSRHARGFGVSTLAAAVGYWVISNTSEPTGAFVQAFAAGALLTMIADEMGPQAFGKSALFTGLATTAGFVLAVFLVTLE